MHRKQARYENSILINMCNRDGIMIAFIAKELTNELWLHDIENTVGLIRAIVCSIIVMPIPPRTIMGIGDL